MEIKEIFPEFNKLSKLLDNDEQQELFTRLKENDLDAFEKIVTCSINLVLCRIFIRFERVDYDKKELFSIGNFGLIKAIKTYDLSKKVSFNTYATKCIDNEILCFLRKLKKQKRIDSLDRLVVNESVGREMKVVDKINDGSNLEDDYINKEEYNTLRKLLNTLPYRDREIITRLYGFNNQRIYTQYEIAEILNLSQSYISRLEKKILKKLKFALLEINNGIELNENSIVKKIR